MRGLASYVTLLQRLIHHQRIDIAMLWMPECPRQAADEPEAQRLPQVHRARVGADDKVELHGPVSA